MLRIDARGGVQIDMSLEMKFWYNTIDAQLDDPNEVKTYEL